MQLDISFFCLGFLLQTLTIQRTTREGRETSLFLSTTSSYSRAFRDLFPTLHVRGLPSIFNHIACYYQTATQSDLTPWRIIFFSIRVFFHEYSRFTGQKGMGEAISLISLCHFHPLHRHLDISGAITTAHSQQPDLNREPLIASNEKLHFLIFCKSTEHDKNDIRAYSRNLGQRLVLARKSTFL